MVGFGIGKTHGAFVGGHVNNAVNLSKALAENGFRVHIVTTAPIYSNREKSEASYELHNGVTIHTVNIIHHNISNRISEKGRLDLSYGFRSYFPILFTIKKLHEKERFDVIHGHSGFPWVASIPEYFSIYEKIPSIHTLYCPINKNYINQIIAKICLSKLDLTIALSYNVRESLKNVIPYNRIKVIPPLVDHSRFNYIFKEQSKFQNLLYLGNLSKSKGLRILLKSFKIVKKDFPNTKLLLGLDMPIDELRSKYNFHEGVIPLGIIENLPEVMARSNIFVAPFTNTYGPADYPLSILEAMASGVPVVATNIGGIPEIVKNGNNGFLTEPNNPLELAKVISYLLENEEETKRMGKNGISFAHNLSNNAFNSYLDLYQNIKDLTRKDNVKTGNQIFK